MVTKQMNGLLILLKRTRVGEGGREGGQRRRKSQQKKGKMDVKRVHLCLVFSNNKN